MGDGRKANHGGCVPMDNGYIDCRITHARKDIYMSEEKLNGVGLALDLTLKGRGETYSYHDKEIVGTVRDITNEVAHGRFRAFRATTDLGEVRCFAVFEQGPLQEDPKIWPVIWQWCESILVNPVSKDDSQEDTEE